MDNGKYLKDLIDRKELLKTLYEQNVEAINTLRKMGYIMDAANIAVTNKNILNRINLLSTFISEYTKGESTDG